MKKQNQRKLRLEFILLGVSVHKISLSTLITKFNHVLDNACGASEVELNWPSAKRRWLGARYESHFTIHWDSEPGFEQPIAWKGQFKGLGPISGNLELAAPVISFVCGAISRNRSGELSRRDDGDAYDGRLSWRDQLTHTRGPHVKRANQKCLSRKLDDLRRGVCHLAAYD